MAQDNDLKIGLGRCTLVRPKQAEDSAQEKIEERADHGAALSQIEPLWDLDRVSLPHGPVAHQEPPSTVHAATAGGVRSGDDYADPMKEAGRNRRLTKEELLLIRRVLAASGDDQGIAELLGRRRLTDEEREHVRHLLVSEMLKHGLRADGSLPPRGRAIDDIIGKLMFY